MKRILKIATAVVAALLFLPLPAAAARLEPSGQLAFDAYIASLEARLERQHGSSETFIAVLNGGVSHRNQALQQLRAGTVVIESVLDHPEPVPGGLLHHWRGAAFVAGAKSQDMLALLRDYQGLPRHYGPEIESSRVLWERAGGASVAIRMKRKKMVTVVLDGVYDIQTRSTSNRGSSSSRSTHIWEVDAAGSVNERHMKEGDDDGFLWRLNSYWSFLEVPGGLLVECEAVSLTRDLPGGLSWLAAPLLDQLPRESLEFTMQATRGALQAKATKETER